MKRWKVSAILVFLISAAPLCLAQAENEINRKVLALYESKMFPDVFYSPLHQHAEIALNYLGLEAVFHPVESPLPTEKEMEGYRGVITWFEAADAAPDDELYCNWLQTQISAGRKVVILREPGFIDKRREMAVSCEEVFKKLGATYGGGATTEDSPLLLEITSKDSQMVEFERKLTLAEDLDYSPFTVLPGTKSYLKVRRKDVPDSESDLVFTSSSGGFVHPT
ncbi:MAG: hypothetical protein Q7S00_01640, partial [bacterium]|nr:hypothetical protein [bacterium]